MAIELSISWQHTIDPFATPTTHTSMTYIVPNADGFTQTVYQGSSFAYDAITGLPTGGTISSISLVVISGSVTLTTLTNVFIGLGDVGNFLKDVSDFRDSISWAALVAELVTFAPTEIVFENADGTFTRLRGSFPLENISGTVDYVELVDMDGATVLQTVGTPGPDPNDVSLQVAASAFSADVLSEQVYLVFNQGNNALSAVNGSATVGDVVIMSGLADGPGNDTITGGLGGLSEFVTWVPGGSAVQIDLLTGLATGVGGTDTLSGIHHVAGSEFNDAITGDALGNVLNGDDGNDTISGGDGNDTITGDNGKAGNDSLDGGIGTDTASYSPFGDAPGAVTVSLAITGAQNTGGAGIDTLVNFENLTGSSLNDSLTGDGNNNELSGQDGADTLTGGGGNDTLLGGAGNDSLYGAGGADTTTGGLGDDIHVVTDFTDVVVEAASEGTDVVESWIFHQLGANVENLVLTGTALTGYGNALNNALTGNASNNLLNGFGGFDTMVGGLGNDTYVITEFSDVATENASETRWRPGSSTRSATTSRT